MANLSWQQLIRQISELVEKEGALIASTQYKQTIISWLTRYQSDESDFGTFVCFDDRGYTKNLVKDIKQGDCNVIVMCWAPAQSSAIHGHEGSRCFVKVLAGSIKEHQAPYPSETNLVKCDQCEKIFYLNDVTYIDDSIGLHKVTNMSTNEPAITLHVYMPSYRKCRIFESGDNELDIKRSKSFPVNFDTIEGKKSTK